MVWGASSRSGEAGALRMTASLAPASYGTLEAIIALVGFQRTRRCERVHAAQRRCLEGDRDACQRAPDGLRSRGLSGALTVRPRARFQLRCAPVACSAAAADHSGGSRLSAPPGCGSFLLVGRSSDLAAFSSFALWRAAARALSSASSGVSTRGGTFLFPRSLKLMAPLGRGWLQEA